MLHFQRAAFCNYGQDCAIDVQFRVKNGDGSLYPNIPNMQTIRCWGLTGCGCVNRWNPGSYCLNYEVRYLCDPRPTWHASQVHSLYFTQDLLKSIDTACERYATLNVVRRRMHSGRHRYTLYVFKLIKAELTLSASFRF